MDDFYPFETEYHAAACYQYSAGRKYALGNQNMSQETDQLLANAAKTRQAAYNNLLGWWQRATPQDRGVFMAELERLSKDPILSIIGFAAVVGYEDMVLEVLGK